MRVKRFGVAAVLACMSLGAMSGAGAVVALTQPGSTVSGYTTPVVFHRAGAELTYTNLDIDAHDVVSDDNSLDGAPPHCFQFPPGGCPLFYSPLIGLGETSPVYGADLVEPGLYGFYCSVHPWMRGTLVVEG